MLLYEQRGAAKVARLRILKEVTLILLFIGDEYHIYNLARRRKAKGRFLGLGLLGVNASATARVISRR